MKILFSPLGMRDPINLEGFGKGRNDGIDNWGTEGSLLQCVRQVRPDLIYLYMTQEICELDEQDNRYEESLNYLCHTLEQKIQISKIKRPAVDAPQDFNSFLPDFQQEIDAIHKKYPDAAIYVNISSGTAGMKSALYVTAAFSPYKIQTVQVNAPGFAEVKASKKRKGNDNQEWEMDLAQAVINQAANEELRAYDPPVNNIHYQINKTIIAAHLDKFDYMGAYTAAESIKDLLSAGVLDLIQAAYYKSILDNNNKNKHLRKATSTFDEYKGEADYSKIIDYYLYLELHVKRGLLLEFVRGMTPFIFRAFLLYIARKMNIQLTKYIDRNWRQIARFSRRALSRTDEGKKIMEVLHQHFTPQFNFNSPVSSENLLVIIKHFSADQEGWECCRQMRDIEIKIRNIAAHDIAYIDNRIIIKETGLSADEILTLFRKILKYSISNGILDKVWNTYKNINDHIKGKL